jgi:hypothetical protein
VWWGEGYACGGVRVMIRSRIHVHTHTHTHTQSPKRQSPPSRPYPSHPIPSLPSPCCCREGRAASFAPRKMTATSGFSYSGSAKGKSDSSIRVHHLLVVRDGSIDQLGEWMAGACGGMMGGFGQTRSVSIRPKTERMRWDAPIPGTGYAAPRPFESITFPPFLPFLIVCHPFPSLPFPFIPYLEV